MLSSLGGNPRYRGENIMKLNLDHPARKALNKKSTFTNQIYKISLIGLYTYVVYSYTIRQLKIEV